MTNPQKAKGDRAELEVQELLRRLLHVPARRMLGAGRLDDVGDIDGVPDTTVQVADWKDVLAAIREKVPGCIEQQTRAGNRFGACFIRRRGGAYVVAMTPEQFAALWLAAQPVEAAP